MTAVPGGRYVRDPKTGKLSKLSEGAPIPVAQAVAPAPVEPAKKGK